MSKSKLKPTIFSIEKNKLLCKKRNLSLNNQLTPTNSFIQENQCFENISTNNIKSHITESKINTTGDIQPCIKPLFKKGKWSEEEDNLLMKYVNKFGVGKWNIIEKHFIGRSRKQIRQRYISNIKIKNVSEDINQNIPYYSESSSDEEEYKDISDNKNIQNENKDVLLKWDDTLDQILLKEYFLNKRSWVKISKKIPGTSENSVKNRFYSLLRQKVNKIKKEYKYNNNNNEKNNNIILLIKKEISVNGKNLYTGKNINCEETKQNFFNNYFDSDFFSNKSKKKNYSVELLLEFLPELLEDKGVNICEILEVLKERKNTAAQKIFIIIEKHYNLCKNNYIEDNDDYNSISTDIEFDNLQNLQSEKLGIVIKNMKLKIMYKYFHRFRYNTLGL